VALVIDVMKPATLGFVLPGMVAEYGIPQSQSGWLLVCALTGTTVGLGVLGRDGRSDRPSRRDPAGLADVHRHVDLRNDAVVRGEPVHVLPDGDRRRRACCRSCMR
jgi:hypothetical protein